MKSHMGIKKYISFFRIRFINGLQYRTAAYAGIATQFVWGAMEILTFSAFYKSNPNAFPMEFSQLSSYIWLQQAMLAIFMPWFLDSDIFDLIKSGNIAYELARPMNIYSMWFTKNLATRLSRAVLRCFPILIVAVFLPSPYGLSAPADLLSFAMFFVTGLLGFFTVVSYCMLVYIACFYTMSPQGVRIIAVSMTEFFTGSIVPLPFLPDKVRAVFELTPFASMQNLPLRVYSGNMSGSEMWYFTGLQIFWLSALLISGCVWIRHALRRVVVQGG